MQNVTSKDTVLTITPTNISYDKNGSVVNKTFMVNKDNLRRDIKEVDFNGFYRSVGGYKTNNPFLEKTKIPALSYVYFRLYAETLKVPSPAELINAYISIYCQRMDNEKFRLKEGYISDRQVFFTYNEIAAYICRRYNSFNRKLFLLAGLAKNHAECDIVYDYHNEHANKVDLTVAYDQCIFLIVFSEYTRNINNKFLKNLYKEYENVFVIPINPKKIRKESLNGMQIFSDDGDEYIFSMIQDARETKEENDNTFNVYLDYDLRPFHIVGIDTEFF